MGYKVLFDDGEEADETVYETYEEAEEALQICQENIGAGAEVLELAGEPFIDPDLIDIHIEEI